MSTFVKYEKFVEDFGNKVHDLFGTNDTLLVCLSNTAPDVVNDTVLADAAELSVANGYTGGVDTQNNGTRSGGVLSVVGTDVTDAWTATGAGFTFRYAILYNDTPVGDPLIGYWDYGSSQPVAAGETVSLNFGATLFTVT